MIKKRSIVINEKITLASTQAFKLYLSEINKFPLLSEAEEEHYGKLAFGGQKEAIDKLITSNLRFVVSISKQFTNSGEVLQNLVNEGNLGLHIAAQRFDPDKGFKFVTFAVWWIRHKINEYLSNEGRLIKLPLNKISEANEINQISQKLSQKLQRTPTNNEILAEMELTFTKKVNGKVKYNDNKLQEILTVYSNNNLSLDKKVSDTENSAPTLGDLIPTFNNMNSDARVVENDKVILLNDILKHLPNQQSKVLKMIYGIGDNESRTLIQIGDELNLTRERVRQIREKGLKSLRKIVKGKSY